MVQRRGQSPWMMILAVVAMSGCASAGTGGNSARSEDVITQEELVPYVGDDLSLVVARLRPQWVRPRTSQTFMGTVGISLIVDGMRWDTNTSRLSEISVASVDEIRYLSASDATTRFGTDMAGGAILVTWKGVGD